MFNFAQPVPQNAAGLLPADRLERMAVFHPIENLQLALGNDRKEAKPVERCVAGKVEIGNPMMRQGTTALGVVRRR
jgi:hypothetical protein